MNLIQEELNKSREYGLEFLPEKEGFPPLVKLSLDNVARAEAMIQVDSKYCKAFDKTAGPIKGKYFGSTAFWMTKLKEYFKSHKILNKGDEKYIDIITHVIESVDRENSTHLNSDGGREKVKERILKLNKNEILEPLRKRSFSLYETLAKKTSPEKGARTNPSFASKFCHYACMFLFEGLKEQDNFSIYDGVLKKMIPHYAQYYGIKNAKKFSYIEYCELIDEIRKKSSEMTGETISRNGFDHLLWYYYKGRIN